MATDTKLLKRSMLEAFKQSLAPTMFLSSFFRTGPRDIFRSTKAVIDIKRQKEQIAVDVVRGTGGRLNQNTRFTTKEYVPPVYDEYVSYNEGQLNDRMPGMTEYDSMSNAAQFLAMVNDDQIQLQSKILRAIEKQASDVLFTGTVVLANGDTIDYKQKTTHNFTVGTSWSDSAATPWDDLEAACILNRKDGLINTGQFNAIMGETAFKNFMNRLTGSDGRTDQRWARLADITLPQQNMEGAILHGQLSSGNYIINVWTYPQYYVVPTAAELNGITLANAGSTVPYVPDESVCVVPAANAIDLRLIYAGIPELVDRVSPEMRAMGIRGIPQNVATDFYPYAYTDDKRVSVEVGVRSAPLCVPTQIDGYTVIDTTA